MLAYVAHRPSVAERRSSPNLMLVIIACHVAGVAAVMSVRMDLPDKLKREVTEVFFVPDPISAPPTPRAADPRSAPQPAPPFVAPDPAVPLPADRADDVVADPLPPLPLPGDRAGDMEDGRASQPPIPATPAVLLTGPGELKPPYPAAKLAAGEETILKLRLSVAADGRVVAVEPIGRADPIFLQAARRHIIAHWRYRPATRDGHGIMAQLVVSLRFQLDD